MSGRNSLGGNDLLAHTCPFLFFAPVVQLDIEKLNKLAEQSKKTTNYNIIRLRGER